MTFIYWMCDDCYDSHCMNHFLEFPSSKKSSNLSMKVFVPIKFTTTGIFQIFPIKFVILKHSCILLCCFGQVSPVDVFLKWLFFFFNYKHTHTHIIQKLSSISWVVKVENGGRRVLVLHFFF